MDMSLYRYADPQDTSLPLDANGIHRLQQIIGTLLFYARAIDDTMHVALGTLAAAQTRGTARTMEAAIQLLNYAATHPIAAVRFHKSDMRLYIHSDASYLSEPQARSRVGGYFYFRVESDFVNTVAVGTGVEYLDFILLEYLPEKAVTRSNNHKLNYTRHYQ
jgi:hypothetical protein